MPSSRDNKSVTEVAPDWRISSSVMTLTLRPDSDNGFSVRVAVTTTSSSRMISESCWANRAGAGHSQKEVASIGVRNRTFIPFRLAPGTEWKKGICSSSFLPESMRHNYETAGLLTCFSSDAPSRTMGVQWYMQRRNLKLTAAGTVHELHVIPFSPCPMETDRLRSKCNTNAFKK